jgi:hypothetical protein
MMGTHCLHCQSQRIADVVFSDAQHCYISKADSQIPEIRRLESRLEAPGWSITADSHGSPSVHNDQPPLQDEHSRYRILTLARACRTFPARIVILRHGKNDETVNRGAPDHPEGGFREASPPCERSNAAQPLWQRSAFPPLTEQYAAACSAE